MKKYLWIIPVMLCLSGCSRDPRSDSFTVRGIEDGNTLRLENGHRAVLLGIAPTQESSDALQSYVNKDVWFVFDSSADADDFNGLNQKFYAYVFDRNPKLGGLSINAVLLRDGISPLNASPLLVDSLELYQEFAQNIDGENRISKPIDPVPIPNNREEDRGIAFSGYVYEPYEGDWSDTPAVFDWACDFRSPCTRDFAASIAKRSPGPFNVGQICEIYGYLREKWSYVNDPKGEDYYARASESIASNARFTGDCDDFAILMASCMMAVGGKARITFSFKPDNGHAFAEVDISSFDYNEVESTISSYFSGVQSLNTKENRKWLNLDWSASHPGGDYYAGTRTEIYEFDNDNWRQVQ